MSKFDNQLIAALRHDARASVTELAEALGASRTTVRTRIASLVETGRIRGFTVVLDGDAHELPIRGVTLIEITGRGNDAIMKTLAGFTEVQAIHTTNGRWDCVLEFATSTLADMDGYLKRLRLIEGISNSETSLYLTTVRSSRPVKQ